MYPERVLKVLQRANARINAGDGASVVGDLEKIVKKIPKAFDGWFLLGLAKGQAGDHAGAETCFRKAAQISPKDPAVWGNMGISYSTRGLFKQALAAYRQALAVSASPHPDTLHNVGSCYLQLDRYDEAVAIFQELVALKDHSEVWAMLGMAFQGLDRYPDALQAYLTARARGGSGYTLNLNIGTCYDNLGDYDHAAAHARAALDFQPGDAVALYNLGAACFAMGKLDEAIDAFARSKLPSARQSRLLAMHYLDQVDPVALRAAHESYADQLGALANPMPARPLGPGQRLRVGFVSADFRAHPVAYFLEGMMRALDRSRLEVFIYADVRTEDAVTARFRALGDHWRGMFGRDDDALAATVGNDRIDVLIDLAGHTNGSRLTAFARRLAPVQASYLGYSGTTGLAQMDYVLVDDILAPQGLADAHYTEKVVRLGEVFATYTPPDVDIDPSRLPLLANGYPTFGSFAQLRKIGPATTRMWIDALKAVPAARLLVMCKGLGNAGAQQRLLQPFIDAGIDRARFDLRDAGSMEAFLRAHHEVDVILDTLPWSGHTTTMHGLWMGVPTLTVEGATQTGRFGRLVTRAAGLDRYLTTAADFGQTAAAIVTDAHQLASERERLRAQVLASPLCDHAGMARRFEDACLRIWEECSRSASGWASTAVL